jgi:hypothetical protein
MKSLSISTAWEETKAILAHDGRLFAAVALALIALPTGVLGVTSPGGLIAALFAAPKNSSPWLMVMPVVVLLVVTAGQLAVTRLALGPSVSVGGAITHAVRRLPSYVAVGVVLGGAITVVVVVAAILLGVTASPSMSEEDLAKSPAGAFILMLIVALYLFLFTRIVSVAAAVTSAESPGPIRIIRRAWSLTSGHFWRILGFVVVYLISASIVLFAINIVAGLFAQVVLGGTEPMSSGAVVVALIGGLASGAVTLLLSVMLARMYAQLTGYGGAQAGVPSSGI